jgi:protein PsiE
MLEAIRRLSTATGNLHRDAKESAVTIGTLVDAFHFLALFVIGATTVWSAAAAFIGMVAQGRATLGDILLLFIYLEIGAMVGVYFKTTRLPVRYLIYIAITALTRVLIEIVGVPSIKQVRIYLLYRAQFFFYRRLCRHHARPDERPRLGILGRLNISRCAV